MTVHEKLEIMRKIYNLDESDIKQIYPNDEHMLLKFRGYREEGKSPFLFLFYLDSGNAERLFNYVGFKDSPNTKKFIMEV